MRHNWLSFTTQTGESLRNVALPRCASEYSLTSLLSISYGRFRAPSYFRLKKKILNFHYVPINRVILTAKPPIKKLNILFII